MLYHYVAADKAGKLIEGDLDADKVENVLQFLAGKEMRPISVTAVKDLYKTKTIFATNITMEDKVFLTRYLALMLRVGTDLLAAINILIADFESTAVKNLLLEIRDNLSRGKPFYEAFSKHPREFSPVFVNLVKAAEVSGNLQQTFEDLSVSLEREANLRKKVRSALAYPIILLMGSLGIFIFLSTFALPRIAKVFLDAGIKPPPVSQAVFGVGLFVNDHIIAVLLVLVLAASTGWYFFFRTTVGRRIMDRSMGRLPVIRKVYRDLAVQRFASTFAALMKAGLPIVNAVKVTADVVGSEEFRSALIRVADEGLAKGLTIGEAFKREASTFPHMLTNLMAVSEKVGHLEQVLETLSNFYASNVESSVQGLVSVLEPILLMIMGLIVGGIALSIIVPIYQLTTQF